MGVGEREREITIGMAYNWPFKLHFCFSVRFRAICGEKTGWNCQSLLKCVAS